MRTELIFATQNTNKIKEIQAILEGQYLVKGLEEMNLGFELPETGKTLAENALQKAKFISENYQVSCFADDSGLEVEALLGAPGIFSARYAGPEKNADANMDKLLFELQPFENRNASFVTVIALVFEGENYFFEGRIVGEIAKEKKGGSGFGYDPIFIPQGYTQTFAELSLEEKNKISHRAIAVGKLIEFLELKLLRSK